MFTRCYLRLDTIRQGEALRSWLAQVTRNVALDWLRRSARETPAGHAVDDRAFTEPLLAVDEALTVRMALDRLPAHQREVLDRFFVRDESYHVIGAELAIPAGTIASRISRALAALRAELEAAGGRSALAGPSS